MFGLERRGPKKRAKTNRLKIRFFNQKPRAHGYSSIPLKPLPLQRTDRKPLTLIVPKQAIAFTLRHRIKNRQTVKNKNRLKYKEKPKRIRLACFWQYEWIKAKEPQQKGIEALPPLTGFEAKPPLASWCFKPLPPSDLPGGHGFPSRQKRGA